MNEFGRGSDHPCFGNGCQRHSRYQYDPHAGMAIAIAIAMPMAIPIPIPMPMALVLEVVIVKHLPRYRGTMR
ncbi:MAG: hypothetical protein AUK55_01745 [Syntrophobacteraceae bacterium CG2_30_61_12]|nr:MAG: hypothetical protein AUK55_01745 [Syntrophobacteraceae bacterium CG2_30_61_12]